jgi:phosphatidate phosphatase APP1
MKNVFLEPYLPVPTIPELFFNLQATLAVNNNPPANFYVSGSPWQTIDPLREFIRTYYSPGEIMLQAFDISFPSIANFLDYKGYKEVMADEVI